MAEQKHVRQEDVCEYFLFPLVPDDVREADVEEYLEKEQELYLAYLGDLLVDYIWQIEPFNLRVVKDSSAGTVPPHLYGRTHYGDNVDDEWFIVHMLYKLTDNFPNLIAKIYDADGEFLLIEAANAIPKWLNPDTSENRIFITGGNLHIVRLPHTPAERRALPTGTPTVEIAVNCIRQHGDMTLASPQVQSAILRRTASFPQKAEQSTHRVHCYVPAAVAAVLKHSPGLVAPAVQAFCHRDPVDMKACRIMQHFRPGTRVLAEVKFTKCLYAQLMKQKFHPERKSDWTLPPPKSSKHKSYDLGMKLAYGFEILCAQCASNKAGREVNAGSAQRPVSGVRWQRFLAALQQKGYFRGELEGSKLYTQLLENAKRYFNKTINTDDSFYDEPGRQILDILNTVDINIEEMRKEGNQLPPEDDDSWLDLTPEQLDDMLCKVAGIEDPQEKKDAFDFSQVSESMKTFVDKVSSHEGAEFPGDDEGDVQFEANGFIESMTKMFEFDDPESSNSSDMDEYGSDVGSDEEMPAKGKKADKKMAEYMTAMDRELAKTTVGKSFEKDPVAISNGKASTTSKPTMAEMEDDDDIDNLDDDDFKPVNVDMTVVKNLLQSYAEQQGLAGPASNILETMGVKVPNQPPKK
ncbi:protein ecdysoneless homolog [Lingula anatina]|uniref:Protein ecdysoneless homolog n=1 Tax=Lingula anatina TaxID=7574 RepID=A0A1S3HJ93_LINAN|nr:protein ecdysoneless homolog [Lingula anatina]|eukprot:XP_013386077.1 protein ecdysoneless homolog [Lingula anatina]